MVKYDTVQEVKDKREELSSEYEDVLPNYLADYLDDEERKILTREYFKKKYEKKYEKEYSSDDYKEHTEKFWNENEFEVVKDARGPATPSFKEAPRNVQRVNDERDLTESEVRVLIQLCEKDLYLFAIRYFPHYLKKPSSSFHKFLYNTLTREFNKRRKAGFKWAVAAPRGAAKSSLMSTIFPLWCICFNKKKFIIIVSDTAGQAEDFLSYVKRELLYNEKLKRDFPYISEEGPTWRTTEIITNNNVKVLALGSGNKIRGRRFGIHRPDLVCMDDLEHLDMIRSETKRDATKNWFDKDVMFVGGEEGTVTDFLVCGTVLGKDSLLNKLLTPDDYPNWKSKRFSAVINFSTSDLWDKWSELYKDRFDIDRIETALKFFEDNKVEMLEGTKVLWPEGDPYYELMIYKYFKPSSFLTEKMNSPIDTTKILISSEQVHWRDFSRDPEILSMLKNKNRLMAYGSLDPSLGKKRDSGDYSCIVTVLRDIRSGYLLVVDINLARRDVDRQIDAILDLHEKWHYRLFGVETNAFQYVVAEALRKKSKKTGAYVPVKDTPNP